EQWQRVARFRLLVRRIPSPHPAAPHRLRLLLIGLVLSCVLSASVVQLAEHRDTSFHTVHELRSFTSLPILVSIPWIATKSDVSRRRRRFCLVLLGLAILVGTTYLIAQDNEQMVWMFDWGRS